MRTLIWLSGLLCLAAPALQSGDAPPKKPADPAAKQPVEAPPKETAPKDVPGILATRSLPETKMYFEMQVEGKPAGYQVSTLTPVKGASDVAYEYRAESLIIHQAGLRIDSLVAARLKKSFEPVTVDIDRQLTHPQAPLRKIEDHAQIGASEIELSHRDTAAANNEHSVAKPKEPFLFGMEFIVEVIDVTQNGSLAFPELDPRDGTASSYYIVIGRESDGRKEMVLQRHNGGIGYRFSVDDKGKVLTWTESTSPMTMTRCTEERYKEVREALQKK